MKTLVEHIEENILENGLQVPHVGHCVVFSGARCCPFLAYNFLHGKVGRSLIW
jgi:hypothetical protein